MKHWEKFLVKMVDFDPTNMKVIVVAMKFSPVDQVLVIGGMTIGKDRPLMESLLQAFGSHIAMKAKFTRYGYTRIRYTVDCKRERWEKVLNELRRDRSLQFFHVKTFGRLMR